MPQRRWIPPLVWSCSTRPPRAATILKDLSSQGFSNFASNFGKELDKLEGRVSRLASSTNRLAQAASGAVGGAANGGGGRSGGTGGTGGSTVTGRNNWLLSPETFSRVIQTQLLVAADST